MLLVRWRNSLSSRTVHEDFFSHFKHNLRFLIFRTIEGSVLYSSDSSVCWKCKPTF